jgi:ammonia channel protein AmtB
VLTIIIGLFSGAIGGIIYEVIRFKKYGALEDSLSVFCSIGIGGLSGLVVTLIIRFLNEAYQNKWLPLW